MNNPFQVLGIDERGINIEQAVNELNARLAELNNLNSFYEEMFKKKYSRFNSSSTYAIRKHEKDDITDFYYERYVLGLPFDKKYFSKNEYFKIVEKAKELEGKPEGRNQAKILNQSLREQFASIRNEQKRITELLELYKSNPFDMTFKSKIEDEYVRVKFEQSVMKLFSKSPLDKIDYKVFREVLENHTGYKELENTYKKVATADAREDLVAELYVKKRIENPVSAISEAHVRRIVGKEKEYQYEFVDNLLKNNTQRQSKKATKNQNHQYGWGIILTDPTYLLKDEPIDTPIFKGTITVEKIGEFSEESLFRKVKIANELRRKRRNNTKIKGINNTLLGKALKALTMTADEFATYQNPQHKQCMRDYNYSYMASKTLYDQIYRVTKTDADGRQRTQIVFSPITDESIGKDVSIEFLKNVYFSDFMLDLARQNGGYAGEVFPAKNGGYNVYNYHPNCEEQIGAAILFDRGFRGTIMDCRNAQKREYPDSSKDDLFRLLSKTYERVRSDE